MAAVEVCRFNRFGYCRFKEMCRHRHIDQLCTDTDCDMDSCDKRHPKACIFFNAYKRCKFGSYCRYSHDLDTDKHEMERTSNCSLRQEILTLSSKIKAMEEEFSTIIEETVIVKVRLEEVELELRNWKAKFSVEATDSGTSALLVTPRRDQEEGEISELKNGRSYAVGPVNGSFPSWSYKTP